MWHKDFFSLARDSCSSILLINYLPQVFTVWVITYQGRDLTVLGPVLTPKRITIEVGLFHKWASYLLASKSSLQMEGWNFFTRGKKIYICQKFWLKTSCRSTNFF